MSPLARPAFADAPETLSRLAALEAGCNPGLFV